MTATQLDFARVALEQMFRVGHFSICTIDNILRVSGGVPNGKDYDTLRLLHCVDFKNMPPNVRIELPRLIQQVIEAPAMRCEIFRDKVIELSEQGSAMRKLEG